MKLLQTMSLSGGIAVLCYWLIKTIFGDFFSGRFYKRLLKLVMFFFVIPFPRLVYRYADLLQWMFPFDKWGLERVLPHAKIGVAIKNIVYCTEEGRIYIVQWHYYLFSAVCLFITLTYMAWQLYRDKKFRKNICRHSEAVKKEMEFYCLKWSRRLKIASKVEIRESDRVTSPITTGCFRPIVVFPKAGNGKAAGAGEETELMLLHELVHIKRKDVFFSVLAMGILALNFYNPFAYYFYREWKRVREIACDEKVIAYAGEEKKKVYGRLILYVAEREMFVGGFQAGFSKKNLTKERIENIMKERKNKWYQKIMGAGLVLGMAFLSSLTVFAYQPDVLRKTETVGPSVDITEMYITEEELNKPIEVELDGRMVPFEFLGCEQEIIYLDEEGNVVIEEYAEQTGAERILCSHSYTTGYRRVHIKNGSGGCTVTIYKTEYCTKCNAIRNETVYGTETHTVCRH